jgi:squalene-hopene/tetraprenyl-beta-curcumene cyclase
MQARAFRMCAVIFLSALEASAVEPAGWDAKAAARYLDGRASWWMSWPAAARDHGTFCISCHTTLPYALARPALRRALAEDGAGAPERKLLGSVTGRVRMWDDAGPFYKTKTPDDPKSEQSRGTEAVLNALILASYDAREGKSSEDTRKAFQNLWALQLKSGKGKGAWCWLNFHNAPWEDDDSQYHGAALAALAVGMMPEDYRSSAAIRENVKLLGEYLEQNSGAQPPLNRLTLLWGSARLPEILHPGRRRAILDEALSQQQGDGGWSLAGLAAPWKRKDGTALEMKSDGYATGLAALALQEAGVPRTQPQLQRGLSWLSRHQDKAEGFWPAESLNKKRDPASDVGRFMSDAATAYAVLALLHSR